MTLDDLKDQISKLTLEQIQQRIAEIRSGRRTPEAKKTSNRTTKKATSTKVNAKPARTADEAQQLLALLNAEQESSGD